MIVHVTDMVLTERMWPVLAPMLERAMRHNNGREDTDDVLAAIKSGNEQLWVAWDGTPGKVDAVMTTTLQQYPKLKALSVKYVAGGKMKTWLAEFIASVEQFAAAEGATLCEGYFREGWERVWPGCRRSGVGLIKELAA